MTIYIVEIDVDNNGGMTLYSLGTEPIRMAFTSKRHAEKAHKDLRIQMILMFGSEKGESIEIQLYDIEVYKTQMYMEFTRKEG